jgi:predicted dehydrogenase
MNFFVVGLGSMGKRRIRCLQLLGYTDVFGFDLREDRRDEAHEKYGIKTFSDIDKALTEVKPAALIISVPPDIHHIYMKIAIENKINFFVEASVVDTDMEVIKEKLTKTPIVAAPSATLLFHPAIQKISDVLKSKALGKVSNIIFHSGQYLHDWHTYEKVSEYYVSNPATGGAREIVPFELTWLTHLFGFPKRVCGNVRKTIDIKGAEEIDDTYNFLLDYKDFLAMFTIDVVSRYATRRLIINGDEGQLLWDWNLNQIQIYDPIKNEWENVPYEMKSAEAGYNPNIGENMYIDELNAFIQAVERKKPFVNSMENDHKVLKLLYAIERADKNSTYIGLDE